MIDAGRRSGTRPWAIIDLQSAHVEAWNFSCGQYTTLHSRSPQVQELGGYTKKEGSSGLGLFHVAILDCGEIPEYQHRKSLLALGNRLALRWENRARIGLKKNKDASNH